MSRTFYLLGHIEEKEEIMSYFSCGKGHSSKGFVYMSRPLYNDKRVKRYH